MIRPPHGAGAAFSEASDGDVRNDVAARASLSEALGISESWAMVRQVHGGDVVEASEPGWQGEADALWTPVKGLPLAVFTADCFGIVLKAPKAVGVAHAGWRGTKAGVIEELRSRMTESGHMPRWAAVGPGIENCCFEVGPEVSEQFPADTAVTTWETPSVDLEKAIGRQLEGIDVWVAGHCTRHEEGWFSHRRDATTKRLAAVGWFG